MASDSPNGTLIGRDSLGTYLVILPDGEPKHRWPAYKIEPRGRVDGPNLLGNWLRFVPSAYAESPGPYPPAVQALLARLSRP